MKPRSPRALLPLQSADGAASAAIGCTFRGIDFELQDLQADAGGKGISISTLRSDADFNAVMRFPELVLRYDWPALARETGV